MKSEMIKSCSPNSAADQLRPVIQRVVALESYVVSTLRHLLRIFLFFMISLKKSWAASYSTRIELMPTKGETEMNAKPVKKMSVSEVKEAMDELLATTSLHDGDEVFGEEVSVQEVSEAFGVFDENKDGFIDAEEVKRVLGALGFMEASEAECEAMIEAFDDNGDGRIDFEEFAGIVEASFR